MESLRHHLISLQTTFISCLLLLFSTTTTTTYATATDFIRASCNDTSYPSLCYTTLSPHARCINYNKALLAKSAITISLRKSKAIAAYATHLNKTSTPEFIELSPVLDDCVSTLKEAADLARNSVNHMKEIISVKKKKNDINNEKEFVRFKVGDVQTWMSAALSNQETCIDGFKEVGSDGLAKADVVKRVKVAKMVTSNALALINRIVDA